jgi:hypothetical protein
MSLNHPLCPKIRGRDAFIAKEAVASHVYPALVSFRIFSADKSSGVGFVQESFPSASPHLHPSTPTPTIAIPSINAESSDLASEAHTEVPALAHCPSEVGEEQELVGTIGVVAVQLVLLWRNQQSISERRTSQRSCSLVHHFLSLRACRSCHQSYLQ